MDTPPDDMDASRSPGDGWAAGEQDSTANPGYALHQLTRALATNQEHSDPDTRARAGRRASDWLRVFGGMISGKIRVGSRAPVAGVPAWATPRIVQGGFATGDLLAGGPLLPPENDILRSLPVDLREGGRSAINAYYLSERGFEELLAMLESGRYRVDVPEEGALLTVAWLAREGYADAARAILDGIAPHFGSLRFYPRPAAEPPSEAEHVRLLDVGEAVRTLEGVRTPDDILTQNEAYSVWLPHADRVVALFAETVEGPLPELAGQSRDGRSVVEGGWPCQTYPDGWATRARAVLEEYERLRAAHTRCSKPERPSSNPARLRAILAVAVEDPSRLTGRDVGVVRTTLAQVRAKRGLPGSGRLGRLRDEQARVSALPSVADWSRALTARLSTRPPGGGLDPVKGDLEAMLAPVSEAEAAAFGLPAGAPFPDRFRGLLLRATDAPIEQHITWGTISSGEMLARVVPRLAGAVRSAALADPALRRLDEAVYAAFRRRRSVLLLDLQSQVKLTELPWVGAIEPLRTEDAEVRIAARSLLRRIVTLALEAFPQQVLPNKLLQEVRALASLAAIRAPIVDEIAADIFMGTFSEKYLRAAQAAAEVLEGTLYERYFGIDYAGIRRIGDVRPSRYGPPTSPAFDRLCHERAGVESAEGWRPVAVNGAIVEQEQVLTSHNLAVLFDALSLGGALGDRLAEMAQKCFVWVCDELSGLAGPPWGQLRSVKNAAYAWRQMVFYLSLVPPQRAEAFFVWADTHLAERSSPFQTKFQPLLARLASTAKPSNSEYGRRSDVEEPFYGWAAGPHWVHAAAS